MLQVINVLGKHAALVNIWKKKTTKTTKNPKQTKKPKPDLKKQLLKQDSKSFQTTKLNCLRGLTWPPPCVKPNLREGKGAWSKGITWYSRPCPAASPPMTCWADRAVHRKIVFVINIREIANSWWCWNGTDADIFRETRKNKGHPYLRTVHI